MNELGREPLSTSFFYFPTVDVGRRDVVKYCPLCCVEYASKDVCLWLNPQLLEQVPGT